MGGKVTLVVPAGFGMDLDVELAFTRDARREYHIEAPGGLQEAVSADWDGSHGSPRKVRRMSGAVNGGGHPVKVRTINGDVKIVER
jgi:hypothetical protein